jgi:hypothetical protein
MPALQTGTGAAVTAEPDELPTPEKLLLIRECEKQRAAFYEQLIQRIALVTGKSPNVVAKIIEKKRLDTIASLAEGFKIEHTKFYRKVINPIKASIRKK